MSTLHVGKRFFAAQKADSEKWDVFDSLATVDPSHVENHGAFADVSEEDAMSLVDYFDRLTEPAPAHPPFDVQDLSISQQDDLRRELARANLKIDSLKESIRRFTDFVDENPTRDLTVALVLLNSSAEIPWKNPYSDPDFRVPDSFSREKAALERERKLKDLIAAASDTFNAFQAKDLSGNQVKILMRLKEAADACK